MLARLLRPAAETRADQFVLPTRGLMPQPTTGPVTVNEATILSIPAAYRCVQIISDTIASLPLGSFRAGIEVETPRVLAQPDPSETRVDTVAALVTSLLIDGNAYALVGGRDPLGHPTSLVVLAPSAVFVQVRDGEVVYRIGGHEYDSDDVLHIRGVTLPGHSRGMGPLEVQRRTLGLAIAGEDYAGESFVTGAMPSGVIQSDSEMTKDEAEAFKAAFVAAHGGRQRSPAVLSGGVTYQALSFSPADIELLDSRRFNAGAVCTIFGVPGFLVGVASGDSKTYSNVQQDTQLFVSYTLRPWITRLEASLSQLLPRGQEAKFNLDGLLRSDTMARYQAHEVGLRAGFLTIDEVRELEDLDPLAAPGPEPDPEPAAEEEADG